MTDLTLFAAAVPAAASIGAAAYFRRQAHREKRRADLANAVLLRERDHAQAVEDGIDAVTFHWLPAVTQSLANGHEVPWRAALPQDLAEDSAATEKLHRLAAHIKTAAAMVDQQRRAVADQAMTEVIEASRRREEKTRQDAINTARSAVRSFSTVAVSQAARLSSLVSAGVRRHISEEAYATLLEIDHHAQQLLSNAAGYVILGGGKPTRRWPATTLTDVVRSAMGRVPNFQRVQLPDSSTDAFAVVSRAVEAVVHATACLLDNALRYSPPNAPVTVSVAHGAAGAFIFIDDAGLRIEDDHLRRLRLMMTSADRNDITKMDATPQTGLRVAAMLADLYGFRVELTSPNVYNGTRAVIILPKELLTAPPHPTATAPAVAPAPVRADMVPGTAGHLPAVAMAAVPAAAVSTTPSGLTVRKRGAQPAPQRRPAPPPAPPGSPHIAAAWQSGTLQARNSTDTPPREGRS
jgi:K+-sensing histidine kinase KdpD